MLEQNLRGFGGILVILTLAWILSEDKKRMDVRLIGGGLFLQFALAIMILKTAAGKSFFESAHTAVVSVVSMSDEGAKFLFGATFEEHFFAFKVLPTVIFVSSLSYMLFYLGVVQRIISVMAFVMKKVMNISGVESVVTVANVFCGQTEAPLFVIPYLKHMTRSEINTMMTGGMATIGGGILVAYVGFGISAGHLLAASLMAAPGAILISKIIFPEVDRPKTMGHVRLALEVPEHNILEAACKGASEGIKLCLNVGAMLIAFIAIVALINKGVASLGNIFGYALSLDMMLAYAFQPLALIMGIPFEESFAVGKLLGEKMLLNEFIAYVHLKDHIEAFTLSERSIALTTYALSGFANFSSIAIQIGGIGSLAPERKRDFVTCGFKAMLGGTLASILNACIASFFIT